ncbi:MAG: S4 domain-containing protein [Nanoarchaeota archaeon]
MTHLKRQIVPKSWPLTRKGTKYVVTPNFNLKGGLPMLIILRNILGVARTRKEVKQAIQLKKILINNKPATDEKNNVLLFDTLTIIPSKKNYRVILNEKGMFNVEEIKESEINHKIAKIADKKILKGKKIQLNFSDGRNLLSDMKCKVNDSALINFKNKKVEKCLPLQEKANVLVFEGKHAGKKGTINKVHKEMKMVEMKVGNSNTNVLIKQIIVIE